MLEPGDIVLLDRVLNALRHQRFGHITLPSIPASGRVVLNALRHQRFGHGRTRGTGSSPVCAQRLTASEVWTLAML